MKVDPVTLEVVRGTCSSICREMNASLVRSAYSPNVKEREDCSCALFDADGELVAQSESIPVHLGAMPFSVESVLEEYPPGEMEPGDSFLLNDPYRGNTHLPDVTLVTPVFRGGGLVGYAANRAHHADVGGSTPGSISAEATDISEEGVRIPPTRAYREGEPVEGVLEEFLERVRSPEERKGDLRAQLAANERGRARLRELAEEHGPDRLKGLLDEVKDYSERRTRSEISSVEEGSYSFSDRLDGDGLTERVPRIEVEVTVEDDSLHVDFSGTSGETEGPLNSPFAVTASAVYFTVRALTDPDIPPNAGCYRPVEVEAPKGSLVNPEPPAPVAGGNLETSQRIVDCILGAMAEPLPERVPAAGQGTMNNVTLGRGGDGEFAFYETLGGGFGGGHGRDGMDGVHVHMSNTLNTPVESLENAYPLRVERYGFREGSGGAGRWRGGLGVRRDIRVLVDGVTLSLLADRRRGEPYGLSGGESGKPGRDLLDRGDGFEEIRTKTVEELGAGDLLSLRTPGGGGYGPPEERERDLVRKDLENGKVTDEEAERTYRLDPGEEPS